MTTQLLGAGNANIATPFPLSISGIVCNRNPVNYEFVWPHPTNNGQSITIQGAVSTQFLNFNIFSNSNATLVYLNARSIGSAGSNSYFAGIWPDVPNGYIWLLVGDFANPGNGCLGKYDYVHGGPLTQIGGGFTGPTNVLGSIINTPTLQMEGIYSGSTLTGMQVWNGTYNFTVSVSTGSITTAENQLLLNGNGIAASSENLWYGTADKTLFARINCNGSSGFGAVNQTSVVLFRNGTSGQAVFDNSGAGGFGMNTISLPSGTGLTGALTSLLYPWGANQVCFAVYTGGYAVGPRMYNRPSFDGWLQGIATSIGMP
jgi:hypothetical protein